MRHHALFATKAGKARKICRKRSSEVVLRKRSEQNSTGTFDSHPYRHSEILYEGITGGSIGGWNLCVCINMQGCGVVFRKLEFGGGVGLGG